MPIALAAISSSRNGHPGAADAAALEAMADDHRQHDQDQEKEVVVGDLRPLEAEPVAGLAEGVLEDRDLVDPGDALGAVGDVDRRVEVVEEHAHDLAEAEGDDRQVVAAQLQRRRPEQHAEEAGHRRTERDQQPPGHVQAVRKGGSDRREGIGQLRRGEQAQHVGADRIESDVAEVEQAGVADDDVEAEREQDVQQRDVDDADPGVARHLHHERQGEQEDRADDPGGELVALGEVDHGCTLRPSAGPAKRE
jgi:hypothetical protein